MSNSHGSFLHRWLAVGKDKVSINSQLITIVTYKRASGQCYLHGLCLALYSVLLFVAPLPRYGTVPFVPAALILLVFLPSGRSKVVVVVVGEWHRCSCMAKVKTSFGGCIYLFGEGDRAFFRGLLDRSLLLLFLPPLIDDHMSDYM